MGRQRNRDQRGSQLVEFAIILPILLMLALLTVDFANAFNDYQSVRSGVGDADRMAVVNQLPTVNTPGCNATDISHIHMAAAPAAGSSAAQLICYAKTRIGLNLDTTRIALVFNAPLTAGQPFMVCAQYPIHSITGAFTSFITGSAVTSQAETVLDHVSPATPDSSLAGGTVREDPITSWPSKCSAASL
jgi:Flp pilus assembly protein TadG